MDLHFYSLCGISLSPRYFIIVSNFHEFKQSVQFIADTNNTKIGELGNNFSDMYLAMRGDNDYMNEEDVGLTNSNLSLEDIIKKNEKVKDRKAEYLFSDVIRFWGEIVIIKNLFRNLALLIVFQLFLPSIYSGTTANLKDYYRDNPHLWYRVGLMELLIRFITAYVMNLSSMGRRYTKVLFLLMIILGSLISKRLDPKKTENLIYMICLTRVSAEAVNFINNVHLIEIFPTIYRLKAISILALVARLGSFLFPIVFENFHKGFSNLIVFYSIIGIVVTIPTNETYDVKLKNYTDVDRK